VPVVEDVAVCEGYFVGGETFHASAGNGSVDVHSLQSSL
jgi:hypothetical protein